jgi:hypothetical protein
MRDCGKDPVVILASAAINDGMSPHHKNALIPFRCGILRSRKVRDFFAQEAGAGSKIRNYRCFSGIGTRFLVICRQNIFFVIIQGRILLPVPGIMFKCPAVVYVDPQNLMTNRRNPPSGTGVGSEGKTVQVIRYK